MDRTERFYKICQLLESRRIVTRQEFLQSLEVSLATFKRDLEYLRDRYNAPITWDREKRGDIALIPGQGKMGSSSCQGYGSTSPRYTLYL